MPGRGRGSPRRPPVAQATDRWAATQARVEAVFAQQLTAGAQIPGGATPRWITREERRRAREARSIAKFDAGGFFSEDARFGELGIMVHVKTREALCELHADLSPLYRDCYPGKRCMWVENERRICTLLGLIKLRTGEPLSIVGALFQVKSADKAAAMFATFVGAGRTRLELVINPRVPPQRPLAPAQRAWNLVFHRYRSQVERPFGVVRRSFRILQRAGAFAYKPDAPGRPFMIDDIVKTCFYLYDLRQRRRPGNMARPTEAHARIGDGAPEPALPVVDEDDNAVFSDGEGAVFTVELDADGQDEPGGPWGD